MLTKQEIEWGKKNTVAWGWLTEEQKEILKEAQNLNILEKLYDLQTSEHWSRWVIDIASSPFNRIFRINPAYQPEPGVERVEITPDDTIPYAYELMWLGTAWNIEQAAGFVAFICFEYADGSQSMEYRRNLKHNNAPAEVAKYVLFAKE